MALADAPTSLLLPDAYSPRIAPVFTWYVTAKLIPGRFHAVRIVTDTLDAARSVADLSQPLLVVMNHQSWWDPMIGLALASTLWPARRGIAPMDATQLQKFQILRKIGIFGIHPDNPASMAAMLEFVDQRFAALSKPTLMLTPQGQFVDVRLPIEIRPGVSALAARFPTCRVVSVAIEYTFWLDQKPEVLIRFQSVPTPDPVSTTAWHRALTQVMTANSSALAALVQARDAAPFTTLIGGSGSGTNPFYNLWNRLRGRSTDLSTEHRTRR
ncbi:MAG: lysophospholipid acyltransferase family protein [Planctomycetes bacterium]|nr:lysophospholipid acyltransferase family protein [Planctomycetota bacterium]